MSEIIIQTKVTTPRLSDKIVHRARLTSLLHENINKNLIIICAPAGFGKTTLVLDYLSYNNNNHAWLSIPHKGMEDPSTFFEYIIGAIRKLNDKFGNTTHDVIKMYSQNPKMSKELVYACTASFVNEFSEYFKNDVILVIDDLHFITSEKTQKWAKEFFNVLLDNIPSNLHLIIISRTTPDLTLTQLKAKRNVFIIEEDNLVFTEDETSELLDEIYKFKYAAKDIKVLDKNIKGWITGLHLLLQAYGEDFAAVNYSKDISFENIYDFFAQEIFDNLSPELQEFMMVTSLMESFDEELVNSVLEISNSKELTNELLYRNLFIHQIHNIQVDKKKVSFSYHALFRDFLNNKLKLSKIEKDLKKLMEKIGDGYAVIGDEVTAINYFMSIDNFNKATPLIDKNIKMLLDSGKYDLLWKWLKSLPDIVLNSNPNILVAFGYLYCYVNTDFEISLDYLSRAEKSFNEVTDEDRLIDLYETKYYVMFNTGKIDESKLELEKILKRKLKPRNVVKISCLLAYVYAQLRMIQKSIDLLENVLKFSEKNNLNKSRIYNSLATTYTYSGDFRKAIYYFKKVELDNSFTELSINLNLSLSYYNLRDYSSSIKYFNKTLKYLNTLYFGDRYMQAYLNQSLLYFEIGDHVESIQILDKIYVIAIEQNSIYNLWHASYFYFLNYYYLNDYENCLKYLKMNGNYSEELNIEHYKNVYHLNCVLFLLRFDVNPSIPEMLKKSYSYFESISEKESIIVILKNLAHYFLLVNNSKTATDYLMVYPSELGFLSSDLVVNRILIDFVLSNPEFDKYKSQAHYAFTDFFDRLNIEGTSDEYKKKMKIEIEKIYDINMKSFGTPEFMYRGKTVPESKWRKKKGKSILAYMMMNPKAKHNKDKIIDMFFPDAKPATVEDSFKQAIFNIRSVFKNQYLNFLILEGKTLYLNPDCYFKSDAEEFNKLYNKVHSSETTKEEKIKACKDAIELYKGEFFEGNYEQWCEDIRSDFYNKYISISELLLDLLCESKNYEEVIYYSEKLLKHDKLSEMAYLSLVNTYVNSEKIKSAKKVYSLMLKTYEKELGEKPEQKLLKKIHLLLES